MVCLFLCLSLWFEPAFRNFSEELSLLVVKLKLKIGIQLV